MRRFAGINLFIFALFFILHTPIKAESFKTLVKTGNKLLKKGKFRDAAEFFKEAISKNPAHYFSYRQLGLCYRGIGSYRKAESYLKKALQKKTDDWPGMVSLATVYWSLGRFKDSLKWYKKGLELKPGHKKILKRIASVKKKLQENSDGGKKTPQAAGLKAPPAKPEVEPDPQTKAKAMKFNQDGVAAINEKNYASAITLLGKAYGLFRQNATIVKNLTTAVRIKANVTKNYDEGINYLRGLYEGNPQNPEIIKSLAGLICIKGTKIGNKNYHTAKELFEEAIGLSPNDFEILFNFALLEHRQKLFDNAEEHFARAVNYMKKPDANFFAWRGINFELLGKLDKAEENLLKALKLRPDYPGLASLLQKIRTRKKLQKDMQIFTYGNFRVFFKSEKGKDSADEIGNALLRAYDKLSNDLDFTTNRPILVICYSKDDYQKTTNLAWSGGNYDGTINMPLEYLTISIEQTLIHEYTHYVIDRIAGSNKCPIWLNEGMAEYECESWGVRREGIFRKMLLSNRIPAWNAMGFGSGMTGSQVRPNYIQAYTIAEYLVETQGHGQIKYFMECLKEGQSIEEACLSSFQDGMEGLQKSWLKWAREKYQ
ncbi:tetratricopeptide repeat protein [Candidatus Riflebacteria bacterium]